MFVLLSTLFLTFAACDGSTTDDPDGDAGNGGSGDWTDPGTGGTRPEPIEGGSGGDDPNPGGSGGDDPGPGGTGGDEPGPGGSGGQGTGGTGGKGGSGGTGGMGGRGGTGGKGGTGGGVAPLEYEECTQPDEVVHLPNGSTLVCVADLYVMPMWLFYCETSADCPNPLTFCGDAFLGEPYCLSNHCGNGDSFFVSAENGDFFEPCNPEYGVSIIYDERGRVEYEAPASLMTGTCLPLVRTATGRAQGFCHASGYVPEGGQCGQLSGGRRSYGSLCQQGNACSTDGTCFPVCDARGRSSAAFSSCSSPAASCEMAVSDPPTDRAIGFCVQDEGSACEAMCDQVYDCGWGFGPYTLDDCYEVCSVGGFSPEEVSCIQSVQGCGSAALGQVNACIGGGPACTDEFDESPRCEECLDDALETCTSTGGVCASVWNQFVNCAVLEGCSTVDCGRLFCPAQWDRYVGCITSSCDEYWACFP